MTKSRFNLRNVVKIGVACLAVCMMFSGCKDPNDDPKNPDNPDNPGGNGSGLSAWTKVTSPLPSDFQCIAFGDGKFVAGSENSMVAISSDNGKTWTTKKITEKNHRINSIIYANGKFVAIGGGSKVFYATNPAEDWTMAVDIEEAFDIRINVIYFDGTRYVSGNTAGEMAYSTDLVNWTANTTNVFTTEGYTIYGYASGKGKLVAVGEEGKIAYADSPGGEWTLVSGNPAGDRNVRAITYANNTFVAVGSAVGTSATIIYTDNPASTWTKASNNVATAAYAIVYGGGYYVLGGSMGGLAYATKLDTWTQVSDSKFDSNPINGIAFGNNTFIAVGGINNNSTIAYATIK